MTIGGEIVEELLVGILYSGKVQLKLVKMFTKSCKKQHFMFVGSIELSMYTHT